MFILLGACSGQPEPEREAPAPAPQPTVAPAPTGDTTSTPPTPSTTSSSTTPSTTPVAHPDVSGEWTTSDAEFAILDDVATAAFGAALGAGDLDGDGAAEIVTGESWAPPSTPAYLRTFAPPFTPPGVLASQSARRLELSVYPILGLAVDDLTGDGLQDLIVGFAGPSWEPGEAVHLIPGPVLVDGDASALAATTILSTNPAYADTADVDGDGARELVWSGWGSIVGGQTLLLETPVPPGAIDQATLPDFVSDYTKPAVADDDSDGADTLWFAGATCFDRGLFALDHLPVGSDVPMGVVAGLGMDPDVSDGCVSYPFGLGDVTGDGHDDVVLITSWYGPDPYVDLPLTLTVHDGPLGVEALRQPWMSLEGYMDVNHVVALDLDGTGLTDLVFELYDPFAGGSTSVVLVEASPGAGLAEDLATWHFGTSTSALAVVPDADADGLDELAIQGGLAPDYAVSLIFGA